MSHTCHTRSSCKKSVTIPEIRFKNWKVCLQAKIFFLSWRKFSIELFQSPVHVMCIRHISFTVLPLSDWRHFKHIIKSQGQSQQANRFSKDLDMIWYYTRVLKAKGVLLTVHEHERKIFNWRNCILQILEREKFRLIDWEHDVWIVCSLEASKTKF